jgi:hypothetical protein
VPRLDSTAVRVRVRVRARVRARVRDRVRDRVRVRVRVRVRIRARVRVWVRPCLASRQRPCRHQADRRRGWLGRAKPRRWRLQH